MRVYQRNLLCLIVSVVAWLTLTGIVTAEQPAASTDATSRTETAPMGSGVIAELAKNAQPTFGFDRIEALQHEVGGYPLWQYVASLTWVILAFGVAAFLDFLLANKLRKLTARTKTDLDEKLLEVLRGPVKAAVFLVMLNVGIRMFQWPEWAEMILATLFTVAIAGIITYLILKLVDLLLGYVRSKFFAGDADLSKLLLPILGRSVKVFIIVIAALTTAQYLGLPITSVIAGLGIGGIAVALAAQNTLANVFGTITILADRPFRAGERVQIDKYDGTVESIGLRSTRIRTLEGHVVTVPNKMVADSAINNVSLRPTIRQLITISLTYDTKPQKMQEAITTLREIFQKHPLTHDAWIYWKDYAASSLDIFVVYWCKSTVFKEFLQAMEEINLEIKRRFDAAGLDFAFPTQTIHLHQEK